jgi:hypothetical protein
VWGGMIGTIEILEIHGFFLCFLFDWKGEKSLIILLVEQSVG